MSGIRKIAILGLIALVGSAAGVVPSQETSYAAETHEVVVINTQKASGGP